MQKEDIIKQMEPTNAALHSLREALYAAIVSAIIQLVRPFMTLFPDGISCNFLYRYINEDCCQSVYRIKKIMVVGNSLLVLADSDNGNTYPEEMSADYDDDFENESADNLSVLRADTFWIDYAQSIYDQLHGYVIPRLLKKIESEKES